MNILIVAHFTQIPSENGNNRFNYIANLLGNKKENKIELITTQFSHKFKKLRNIKEEELKVLNYKLTMIKEPGYKKNISLKRFFSHYIFSKNLKKYLKTIKIMPDVIYCAIPTLNTAKVVAEFAKKNNIRFILDIQDLWPEAFKMVFNIPFISDIIFLPMEIKANNIYKKADSIVAVSNTYLERAKKINKKSAKNIVVFLGTNLEEFDKNKKDLNKDDTKITIVYIGTLGHSYNIKLIIDAIKVLNKKGFNNIKFLIMGDGPLKEEFMQYAKKNQIDCVFTGMIKYDEMISKLCICDIAVNPINSGSAGSIINKVGDYAAAGLPVINTQENKEYRNLVEEYNIGFNCNNNKEDVAEKIEMLINNETLRKKMGNNNRKLAEEKFDRKKNYKKIVNLIEKG